MATRERGFMGEPFPSKKFQQVIAEFLGNEYPEITDKLHSKVLANGFTLTYTQHRNNTLPGGNAQ